MLAMIGFMMLLLLICSGNCADVHIFNDGSACSNAFDFKKYEYKTANYDNKPRVFTEEEMAGIRNSSNIKLLNAGMGTTGTTEMFHILCKMGIPSVHGRMSCHINNGDVVRPFVYLMYKSPSKLLGVGKYMSSHSIEVADFFTDSPVANIFSELVLAAPDAALITTYRNPAEWAKRRVERFPGEPICQPEYWNDPLVLHPYDWVGCQLAHNKVSTTGTGQMSQGIFVHGNMDPRKTEYNEATIAARIKDIENAYIQTSTVLHVLAGSRPFLPLCLTKGDPASASENVTEQVKVFLHEHKITTGSKSGEVHEW